MTLTQALERIRHLEAESKELRERLYFQEYHPTLAAGFRGETLVAKTVDGQMTLFTAGNDVTIEKSGLTIEVKFSTLNTAIKGRPGSTKRWTWARPLGSSNNKIFDRLILVGESDSRFASSYKGEACPYVFFDVPKNLITDLAKLSGTHDIIQISTNPLTARTPVAILLFNDYQIGIEELKTRYGIAPITDPLTTTAGQ